MNKDSTSAHRGGRGHQEGGPSSRPKKIATFHKSLDEMYLENHWMAFHHYEHYETLIALEEKLAAMQVVGRLDIETSCPLSSFGSSWTMCIMSSGSFFFSFPDLWSYLNAKHFIISHPRGAIEDGLVVCRSGWIKKILKCEIQKEKKKVKWES